MSILDLEVSETARQKVATQYPGLAESTAKAVAEAYTLLEKIDERYSSKDLWLGGDASYSEVTTAISQLRRIPTPEEVNQALRDYTAEREPLIRAISIFTAGYMPIIRISAGDAAKNNNASRILAKAERVPPPQ